MSTSNLLRFRAGQVQLVRVPVARATIVHAGDLVIMDKQSGLLLPVSNARMLEASTIPAEMLDYVRGRLSGLFIGVSHQQSREGEDDPLSVDVSPTAVYEFNVPSAEAYRVGDMFTFALTPEGVLDSQKLFPTMHRTVAIARAMEFTRERVSTLRVTFASAFSPASANVNAALGKLIP